MPSIGAFISYYLRKGLHLELHFQTGELLGSGEVRFDGFTTYFGFQSYALDMVFMPEYSFFIKPVLSVGMGVFSSVFNVTGGNSTPKVFDMEFRGAAMLRLGFGSFSMDAGIRMRMMNSLGAELWLFELPLIRLGVRF